jgi:hypothetical protein
MKSMNVKAITTLNAKYTPKKKENAFVNAVILAGSMTAFGLMMGVSFVQICCGN